MSNKQKPTEKTCQGKYTKPELYEGYYWLILHVDPYNFSYGFLNEMGIPKDAIHPVPEVIKDAREMFRDDAEPDDIDNEGLDPNHPLYIPPTPDVDVDKIFNWLLEQEIRTLSVEGRNIKQKEDVRILWEHLKIPDPVTMNQYMFDDRHFHELEHYLEPQHKENLETLAQSGEGGKAISHKFTLRLNEETWEFEAIVDNKVNPLGLSSNSQEYLVLNALHSAKGTWVSEEDLLIAGQIQSHKKREIVSERKRGHLQKTISNIRSAFASGDMSRDFLGYDKDKGYRLLVPCQ